MSAVLNQRPQADIEDVQPVANRGTGYVAKGDALARIDGPAKVTGQARYAADHGVNDMLYAVVVNSTIARGRIASLQLEKALAIDGVLDVLSHENRPRIRKLDLFYKDMVSPGGSPFKPFAGNAILYSGQPIALVVATSFEAARYAASLVEVRYEHAAHETGVVQHRARARKPSRLKFGFVPPPKPTGDADAAFAAAPAKIDAEYYSGVEHHNPMEMFATTVVRAADGHMTIHDKTQGSQNCRWMVSHVFGLSKDKVTVKNAFVGGAFGSGLRPQYSLILAVLASIHLRRSVHLVLTRQQMFTFGHRAETLQRVRLAANADGALQAVMHEAVAATSRIEDNVEVVVNWASQLYKCENIKLDYQLVELDQATPMDMRAPGAAHGMHALEVAMDELSYELKMCPLALRLANYTDCDNDGKPFSTKELRACYEQGAERFGWSKRPQAPRSMKEGNEYIGWGMATGTWDAMQMFARCHAVLTADGKLEVSTAASDIGTGTYTVMSQIAAAAMGLAMEDVVFKLGDSTLPVSPVEGGSAMLATVGSAIEGVCDKLKKTLFKLARAMPDSPFAKAKLSQVEFVHGTLRFPSQPDAGVPLARILQVAKKDRVEEKYLMLPHMLEQQKYVRATHSAVFCEVRVDEDFGTVRVTRVVSAIAAGQIMSAQLARSQIYGGVVWGISQALHEESHTDHSLGRIMNHSFAEYHIPVNADIHDIDVIFVEEDDRIVSRIGAKGVGEIGIVSVAAAISNAIFHATGRRVRSTPMTPDKVMRPAD